MISAMTSASDDLASLPLGAFIALAGRDRWAARLAEIHDLASSGPRSGQAIRQHTPSR
jgi:hypothetical protein